MSGTCVLAGMPVHAAEPGAPVTHSPSPGRAAQAEAPGAVESPESESAGPGFQFQLDSDSEVADSDSDTSGPLANFQVPVTRPVTERASELSATGRLPDSEPSSSSLKFKCQPDVARSGPSPGPGPPDNNSRLQLLLR